MDWAERAGYQTERAAEATVSWSQPGGETRYRCRKVGGEVHLTRVTRDGRESLLLAASADAVVDCYLFATFGNVIRDESGLDVLRMPWSADQLAAGYVLTEPNEDDLRSLLRNGEVVATAPEKTLSLLALVPLSHYLGLAVLELMASFLDAEGAPLLVHGRYRGAGQSASKNRFVETHFSATLRLSIGNDLQTEGHYLSFPVSNGVVDYEEQYWITAEQYKSFSAGMESARDFVERCRRREQDDLLIYPPGRRRGSAI